MKRCIIITALLDCDLSQIYTKQEGDYIICADGGIEIAEKGGIFPDIVLGDLDSAQSIDAKYNFIKFPKEKDDTDTSLCLKHGITLGYKDFVIIGGIGGRLDHTIANLQMLVFAKEKGVNAEIISKDTRAFLLCGGENTEIEKDDDFYLSCFSYSPRCEGATLSGTKYELASGELENSFPLGVSNEFKDKTAHISLEKGTMLIVMSRK